MYKGATDLSQRRARQLWLSDLMGAAYFKELPPEEQRANLVRIVKQLEAELACAMSNSERARLGKKKAEVCLAINALRPKMKGPKTVPHFFVDVCRERIAGGQFRVLWDEANARAKAASDATMTPILVDVASAGGPKQLLEPGD